MNKIYYQALLASAMSALIITPAFSETPAPVTNKPALIAEAATDQQNRDGAMPAPMNSSEPMGREMVQPGHTQQEPSINQTMSSELYSMRPNDLLQKQVHNSKEETVGKVSEIVSSRQDGQIHVVISSGGFLGIGSSEYVVPLHSLSMNKDKLYLRAAAEKELLGKEYLKEGYVMIEPKDRPISEFSAFEERQQ